MFVEPASADPEALARKWAVNPAMQIPPPIEWVIGPDGHVRDYKLEGVGLRHKLRNHFAAVFFNRVVTYIPFHFIRQAYLRLFGASIGKNSSIFCGTTVFDIPYLVIGNNTAIGFRCLLDARAGIAIGDHVTIASDTHIIGGGHDVNHPDFLPVPDPVVIDDYVWISSRAMILPSLIGRGAVVAAHALVNRDIAPLDIVGGVPAKVIGKRNPDALQYDGKFKPPFY